jgi:5-methylcytosine-specific restriction endonuclease McrA
VDLTRFADLVADIARRLGEAGDPDTLGQRRAKAIGLVADVHAGADLDDLIARLVAGPVDATEARRVPRTRARDLQLYVHLPAADLDSTGPGGIATVEHLGAVTVARIEDWLARHTATGARVRVTPVVDPARTDAVDRHDPPPWMAEQVRLRDRQCVFPYCQTHARDCDLDHIIPYVPPDEGGPPGQTNPQNLAPLCRRHHRAKTARRWRYERTDDGCYAWTSPHADRYLVKGSGTLALTDH